MSGPSYPLRLELIGDDLEQALHHARRQYPELGADPVRPVWVAEIVGRDSRYGLKRRFLPAQKDYKRANSVGSRGVYATYFLRSGGLYEVQAQLAWRHSDRYFVTILADGSRRRLTRAELEAELAAKADAE